MQNGGKRVGAGRKKTLQSEIITSLRSRITDDDFDTALDTLRFAMSQRKRNLKVATSAAQYILDQKMGRAPQPISNDQDNPFKFEVVIKPNSD